MLTPQQAARKATVSLSLVYHWCDSRMLPHMRLGGKGRRGKILIAEEDFDGFLASFKVTAADVKPRAAARVVLKHLRLPS